MRLRLVLPLAVLLACSKSVTPGPPRDSGTDSIVACFGAGTPIATPVGPVPIEHVGPGLQVYAYDVVHRRTVVAIVDRLFVHRDVPAGRLAVAGGPVVTVTREHPIYDAERAEFVPAEALADDSVLLRLDSDGTVGASRGARFVRSPGRTTVYNLRVAGYHTYFAAGILVHNKSDAGAIELCDDGIDNDGNGQADCLDPVCTGMPCGAGCRCTAGAPRELFCSDTEDNDGDGLGDCADPDCETIACGTGCVCAGGLPTETSCNDGRDNDGDGPADCEDPDCEGRSCGTGTCSGGRCG